MVGDLLDLGELVVVREDDRVLLLRERADLVLQLANLAGGQVAARLGARDGVVHGGEGEGHAFTRAPRAG